VHSIRQRRKREVKLKKYNGNKIRGLQVHYAKCRR
jgi:hypothetical protein